MKAKHMLQRALRRVVIIGGIAALSVASAAPAAQAWSQNWPSEATYRASYDFIPTRSSVRIGGTACTGADGTAFKLTLMRTSGASVIYTAPRKAVDNTWHYIDTTTPYANQAHYMRHTTERYSTSSGIWVNAFSLCQGVSATW
ncbi:hypothetical protein Cme02nite_20630 [Catellatospora methionotrophica]|uniref:Secreted protein n=1 Tax=Catellatospora methionotrophica TaxID=121620 RepID=A0A8J3LEL6_9ACTN|nr:hypothetical protein Cme02nite_20630 [Catellatospora methionotrophica]